DLGLQLAESAGAAAPGIALRGDDERKVAVLPRKAQRPLDPREVGGIAAARLGVRRRIVPLVVVGPGHVDRREAHSSMDPQAILGVLAATGRWRAFRLGLQFAAPEMLASPE